jgi:hypothetical protein
LSANALGRRIRSYQFGKFRFKLLKPPEQLVVLRIAHDRVIKDVIAVIMFRYLPPELGDFLGGLVFGTFVPGYGIAHTARSTPF